MFLLVLLLIPTLLAVCMLIYRPVSSVLLNVYLPTLLLIPMYLNSWIGGQTISACLGVAALLAGIGLWREWGRLRISFADVCTLLTMFCVFYADAKHRPVKIAMYALLQASFSLLCPYLIGRTLIEQTNMREKFVKTFVCLLAIIAVVSLWEFVAVRNPFQEATQILMKQTSLWSRQTRWGFGRVAGPFGHAIIAGMIFTVGFMFQGWLAATHAWEPRGYNGRLGYRSILLLITSFLGLYIALSRGPWIGCGFGLIVACVGLARNKKRAALIAGAILALGLVVTSSAIDSYTAPTDAHPETQDQENAMYRRQLLDTYYPLIQQGGFWGWGSPLHLSTGEYAYAVHQTSIDNEYIREAMAQGYAGLILFILLIASSMYRLIIACVRLRAREDMLFAYTMLGIVTASAFTLTTVFLGDPMLELLFLIFGWCQALRPTRTAEIAPVLSSAQPYVFQQVFV